MPYYRLVKAPFLSSKSWRKQFKDYPVLLSNIFKIFSLESYADFII